MEIIVDLYNRIKLTVFDAYFLLSFSRGKRNIVISFFFPEDLPGTYIRRALRVLILETLRSRFDHFTANDKLRFAVNGFTLPVFPCLRLKIC